MSHEPGPKEHHIGIVEVTGIELEGVIVEIIPHVIKGHNDHYKTSQKIYGGDPVSGSCGHVGILAG